MAKKKSQACNCGWPETKHRTLSEHGKNCPKHAEFMRKLTNRLKGR